MNGMMTSYMWASGEYDETGAFDFSPAYTLALVTLSKVGTSGYGGYTEAGILAYRRMTSSDTAETVTLSAAGQGATPTSFADDQVCSVTFEVWSFDAYGYATVELTFW
jgi:hypothetical protein